MGRKSSSGFVGVYKERGNGGATRWKAEIFSGKFRLYVGTFATIEEAVEARRQACIEHWGTDCPAKQVDQYRLTKKEKEALQHMAWEAPIWRREHLINMMKREAL